MNIPIPNRRQVLQSSTAVAGMTTTLNWPNSLQAEDPMRPMTFVIVTDTHLGRKDNLSAEKNWRRAVAEINEVDADFVLHLGDVVDGGREAQYHVYRETRKTLTKPIHEIPGNHDPAELFQKYVVPKTDRSFDAGGIRFVLFSNAHRDSHDGFITPDQNAWLAKQLDEAVRKQLKVILCCHVPVHTNRNPDRGWYVKPANGQNTFYELLEQHSDRILACLHGHFHNGIRGWRDHGQTVEILCPSVCYNQNRNLKSHIADGRAEGFFVDELRPGYVIAEVDARQLKLTTKPLGEPRSEEYSASWD